MILFWTLPNLGRQLCSLIMLMKIVGKMSTRNKRIFDRICDTHSHTLTHVELLLLLRLPEIRYIRNCCFGKLMSFLNGKFELIHNDVVILRCEYERMVIHNKSE